MAYILEDFLSGTAALDVIAARAAMDREPSFMLENILPEQKVDDFQYEHMIGEYFDPIIASFSAYEQEGIYRGRDGVMKFIEELRPIKQSMRLSGKLLIQSKNRNSESPIVKQLFKDVANVYDGVRVRLEKMRAEVLTTGKLAIEENGVKFNVDYQVPDENKKSIVIATDQWSDTENSDPIADMTRWHNDLDFEPIGGVISKKIAGYLVANKNIRIQMFGTESSSRHPTFTDVNSFLVGMGLPKLFVDKDSYRENDLTKTRKKIWTENKFVWFGENIGSTLCGLTEEGELGEGVVRTENGIYIQVNKQKQPVRITTHGSTTSLVALPAPHELFIADVYQV